jgi:hypothetical protein
VSTTVSISGSGKVDVTVYGNGTVYAGNGNDNIGITGQGNIVVGSGNDTLTLGKGGTITEHGASGHDTIHLGATGTYNIFEQGSATITGAFGSATIEGGGTLRIVEGGAQSTTAGASGSTHSSTSTTHGTSTSTTHSTTTATHGSSTASTHGTTATTHSTSAPTHGTSNVYGQSTLLGGTHTTEFANGHAGVEYTKAMGPDSMGGGLTHHLVALHDKAAPGLLKNFVAGHDHLYLPGHSLVFAAQPHAIATHGDNTTIGLDGGKTTIELHGLHIGDKH